MRPLKQLEAAATSGPPVLPPPSLPLQASLHELKSRDATANGQEEEADVKAANVGLPHFTPRADQEDMELDTKLYTEPLPTNQQVYSNRVISCFHFSFCFSFPFSLLLLLPNRVRSKKYDIVSEPCYSCRVTLLVWAGL